MIINAEVELHVCDFSETFHVKHVDPELNRKLTYIR
jgi:hypothetical protein